MKCPHCLVEFHDSWQHFKIDNDRDGWWTVLRTTCPKCARYIINLKRLEPTKEGSKVEHLIMVYPKGIARAPLAPDIPVKFADDYKEACLVLADSPKASAALSRRCLQNLLREKAGVNPGDLFDEIQQVIDAKSLPSYLAEALDAVRAAGNFAAHPIKSKNTGAIIEVEPGEAEWQLDTLEQLFDFYFVQPALLQTKREALNKKLADAGKRPLK